MNDLKMPGTRRVSERARRLQAPVIPEIAALLAECPDAISLGQGVASYGPPASALAALHGLDPSPAANRYQAGDGMPQLVEAWRGSLERENGIGSDAGTMVVTAGSNMAFLELMAVIADPGDQVIVPAPYFFNQRMALETLGIEPVIVPTDADFQLDVERLQGAMGPRTRAIVTVSPNNPTGAVYRESDLRAVNRLCAEHGCFHVSDEAYQHFVFDGARHFSPASIIGAEDHTVTLVSMSKSYGIAGWRVGAAIVPADLMNDLRKVHDTMLISAPVASQVLAAALLNDAADWRQARVREIGALRAPVLEALEPLAPRVTVPITNGAFYFVLRTALPGDDMALVRRLVREFGVAVIPGSAFGMQGPVSLRVAYGGLTPDSLEEAMSRLVAGLDALIPGSSTGAASTFRRAST